MDTGNIIAFLKKFSFGRLIGSGIVLRVLIAIVDEEGDVSYYEVGWKKL